VGGALREPAGAGGADAGRAGAARGGAGASVGGRGQRGGARGWGRCPCRARGRGRERAAAAQAAERQAIEAALAQTGGKVAPAARLLGLGSRHALYRLMVKHGIRREGDGEE
jgi:hypothetical protein